jgi:cellulose synthase/poly-beta-1,6-N-acetylglucosamine synthase-like glycosyltransferase/peptidoglycan/xylan/chitin deacetylase (PgdA/CDA1 family)/spore germination protein YaaH
MNTLQAPNRRPDPSPQEQSSQASFIFLDHHGKRWPRLKRIAFIGSLLLFLAAVLFVQTLVLPSSLHLPPSVDQLKSHLKALQMHSTGWTPSKPLWLDYAKQTTHKEKTGGLSHHAKAVSAGTHQQRTTGMNAAAHRIEKEIRLGFYEGWDPDSLDSLTAHADQLTHLCPDWLHLTDDPDPLKVTTDHHVLSVVENHELQLMPLLRNLGAGDTWHNEAVEWLINGTETRQQAFITHLIEVLDRMDADGVVLDWQQVDPTYRDGMSVLLTRLAKALHQEQMELWLCIPVGRELKVFDLDRLSHHVDHFIAMLHDENAEGDRPGPIASQAFFKGWLSTLVDGYGRPEQWIVSQGAYGYDWAEGEDEGEHISFQDVLSRAGHSEQINCAFHPPEANPHFVYDDGKAIHTVWFLDAVTFLNQLTLARAHHVGGVAVNRLGNEDPAIWEVLDMAADKPLAAPALEQLGRIDPGDGIAHIGKGNLITITDERSPGKRLVQYNPKAPLGLRYSETYQQFPRYLTILHQGQGPADGVALTFDDGPDDKWTPQLLDVLKERGAKATFFMIGANMEKHPAIVRRILEEGHMIGVHTYSHPNIALVSDERAHLELNATQRLIESITGHGTILFRPPYNADTNPHDPEELVPIKLAQSMGYVSVTEDIDTEDWDKPGVTVMLSRIREGRQFGGNVILLHDAGGDRSQTVAALPRIIDYINARGDRILPLPELLGVPSQQLMPLVPTNQQPWTRMISGGGFSAIHKVTNFFWAFMIVATVLTMIKTLVVSWLAIRSRSHEIETQDPFVPPVSVLIAAYNEEKVIGETLRTVLNTTYEGPMEIVVVDDGSTDNTAGIVEAMAKEDARIRLIRQINHGKAIALRTGLSSVTHGIVVTLDADTQFTPSTLGHLVQPLADPAVAAVSGRARVGNPKTLFARFQSLEYSCGFNLDRRAYHQLNCITVVPGAISALRVSAVREAGGISNDTLAEDTDLTLALHRIGYRICYTSRAIAWTEAPETLPTFAKQRFRWAFGTLQCLWKHRDLLFNTRYRALGWFSLPSAWFFNITLVALGSVIDLILLLSLLISPANLILYFYFFIFLAADLLLAGVACRVEREPLSQIWLVLPMRFVYRPVLNYVVVKAILRALKGVWVGWGKLDRTASVNVRSL